MSLRLGGPTDVPHADRHQRADSAEAVEQCRNLEYFRQEEPEYTADDTAQRPARSGVGHHRLGVKRIEAFVDHRGECTDHQCPEHAHVQVEQHCNRTRS